VGVPKCGSMPPPCTPHRPGEVRRASEATVATKNKTNKSVLKRMKRTASGLLKHGTPGKRHLNAHMTPKRKRQLRKSGVITGPLVKKYLIVMGEY
ncbi:MAG: 50S ribosomal protein L35, partial [Planctomycetia bacterium]